MEKTFSSMIRWMHLDLHKSWAGENKGAAQARREGKGLETCHFTTAWQWPPLGRSCPLPRAGSRPIGSRLAAWAGPVFGRSKDTSCLRWSERARRWGGYMLEGRCVVWLGGVVWCVWCKGAQGHGMREAGRIPGRIPF